MTEKECHVRMIKIGVLNIWKIRRSVPILLKTKLLATAICVAIVWVSGFEFGRPYDFLVELFYVEYTAYIV